MKKSLKWLIIIFFLQSNNIISGQEIDDFEKEKNIEFSIIVNEKGNFNPEGNLSIQYKNEVGIIYIFGTLNLGTKLNPFRIGFFDKQVLKEIYDELVDFINDDYNKLGNSSADSDEGRLSIRSSFPGKSTIQKTIVYYSNYNSERFALYYDKIISLALQYSVIPKISEYYIKDGIKQKLENYKTKNKYFEGLNFITKYIDNFNNININALDLKSVINILANANIPFDIKDNVYGKWHNQNSNKSSILLDIMNYFFENINSYSESAKQEIFNFIERYGDNSILKKLCDAVIKSGDMEMASCAMSNKICIKNLKSIFKDIFLNNINSSDINISITCIQSLDKFYFNRSYVDNFYNLLKENINKDTDNLAMKKQICSLYKAIDKYFDINSNYLCCYNSVDCTHEELKKIFYGVESRIKNKKKWYREIISE